MGSPDLRDYGTDPRGFIEGMRTMIYGYSAREVNEYGLLEMKEITISALPAVLRDISKFLADAADLMEIGGFEACSHRHIQSAIPDWDHRFPDTDIVVIAPKPAQH
jgi:hypothetical protein